MEKIIIAYTDYTKKELESQNSSMTKLLLSDIIEMETQGYTVKFETSLFRQLFLLCKHKVVAYKQ